MKHYTMPDKCHDEDCSQPVGSRWNCEDCPNWEKFNSVKGPFRKLRGQETGEKACYLCIHRTKANTDTPCITCLEYRTQYPYFIALNNQKQTEVTK